MNYSDPSPCRRKGNSDNRHVVPVITNQINDVIGGPVKVIYPDGRTHTVKATYFDPASREVYMFKRNRRVVIESDRDRRKI